MDPKERKAINFFRSYYEAACLIADKAERADFYHAIFKYVFDGETQLDLMGVPAAMFKLAKPNIDSSLKKADAGAKGGKNGSKSQANNKQNESKSEANSKQKESKQQPIKDKGLRIKDKGDINNPPIVPPKGGTEKTDFDLFWEAYPKQKGKGDARKAFEKAIKKGVTVQMLIDAVNRQRCGDQWTRDNGQFIPYPSTWLNQERWDDGPDFTPVDNSQKPKYNPHARNDGKAGYQGALTILEGLVDDEETGTGTENANNYETLDVV